MIDMFMSAKEQDIAEHLTLIDFNIYAAMEVWRVDFLSLTFSFIATGVAKSILEQC